MRWRFLFDWRKVLIYSHRWLGIVGCLLFISWFFSGIVMMYARMPRLTAEERLMRLPALDASKISVGAGEAIARNGLQPDRLRVGTMNDRPVYRFLQGSAWTTVFADTGDKLASVDPQEALRLVRNLYPEHAASIRYVESLSDSDQWTLSSVIRAQMPMHRIEIGDEEGSSVYVSERTGDLAMKTTSKERLWSYFGAVLHYIYFTPFRRHADFWNSSIIWLSFFGCLSCISGIVAGIWRFSLSSRFRKKGEHSHSPYTGIMLWHHYAGLIFGLFSFTWILSGGLSLNPMKWSPGTGATSAQRDGFAGGAIAWDELTPERLRAAVGTLNGNFAAKELEVLQFGSEPYVMAYRAPQESEAATWTNTDLSAYLSQSVPFEHRLVAARHPDRGAIAGFKESMILAAARQAMPKAGVLDTVRLTEYDSYYYDRYRARTLPVWKVRFDDPEETWLYLDPTRGLIAQKQERLSRWNRWLYRGLHSLDFPFLYNSRPLWDIVVILLSLGGILLSAIVLIPSYNRLAKHFRKLLKFGAPPRLSTPRPAPALQSQMVRDK